MPTAKKDYWNSQKPSSDSQFAKYYRAPEVIAVANALYDALDTPATTNRNDLVAILLTGLNIPNSATVPGGLQFTRTGSTRPTCCASTRVSSRMPRGHASSV